MNNLQLQQKDMEKEIAQLESFIKSDIDARELKRAIAVRMASAGNIYHEISLILGVSNFFIGYWKKQFKTKGIGGIKLGHKGSKGYLTALQNTEVLEWLKNKEYWNLDELVTYLEQEFGVIYSLSQKDEV
ncbi:helix-turn-helix domain-containing protein [Microcoleus vaginatus]|uniref:helix-turn-helix domain-containing protein n=1 Tax=Microcoleus vaginatus TaxID=119532 RepID=UPI001F60949E|nr:transposase [Microcoleus vaginatus HSN003]